MKIVDLAYCDRLDKSAMQPSRIAERAPLPCPIALAPTPHLIGAASGVGSYATALAQATGKATQTFAQAESWARKWYGFGISFSQGFAAARGSQSAQTAVATGGVGDFVFGGSYTQQGQGSSNSYGAVLAIDVPWV